MDLMILLTRLFHRKAEPSDRTVLLWLRWLFFMILLVLLFYPGKGPFSAAQVLGRAGLLAAYGLSNVLLWRATRGAFSLDRWSIPVFLSDLALIGLALYNSIGPDTDLYVMCFLIIYLSTLGRRLRDALPLALIACLGYALLLAHQNRALDWTDPRLLLRFPFFFVFAIFTSYLSEQTEQGRVRIRRMQEVQTLLASELQKVLVDLREKQTLLLQAEKMTAMGHMAGALAHEIRNPLSVIVGYVEDLLGGRPAEDPQTQPLQAVKRSAVRCQDLMGNLLRFARRPREIETFLLRDALEEAITLVRISAKMTQVQCTLDAQANPTFSGRRSEIQQIFINLMTNAVDAMPKGGNLTLRLEEESHLGRRWIKVTVQDTGTGIPPEIRGQIFDPFFTTKEPGKGTGLGLSIVQDIIQDYQGLLEVQSEPHRGTVIIVRLPIAEGPAAAPEGQPTPAVANEGPSVVSVETRGDKT
jgi:signal transduction histidine kinase